MPSQVIILGMHRSGTSLAGQALESLGFYFGPENKALAPKKDNPLGYWERFDINDLNDKAFAALGGSWEKIGAWRPENLPAAAVKEFDARASEIIAEYSANELFFIKDPRMCITLPLWEKHLKNPVYLFIYRDPVEIARSLWSRNQYPPRLVMALWERYLADALNATRGKRRLVLRYADLLRDPEATLRKLIADLGQFGITPPFPVENALQTIKVDHTLRHHRRESLKLEIPFTKSQEILHRRIQDGTAFSQAEEIDVTDANRRILASQEIVNIGKTQALPRKSVSHSAETIAFLAEEINRAGLSDTTQQDASGFADRFLKTSRASFTDNGMQAMEALEAIHLLTFYLVRTKALKVGGDYAVATMAAWCDELSRKTALSASFKKTRQSFLEYQGHPPRTLLQVIRRSGSDHGRQWTAMLQGAGKATTELLGRYVLGKFPLLPELPDQVTGPLAVVQQYQASLISSADQIRETLKALDLFGLHLEKTLPGMSASEPDTKVSTDEEDATRMLAWGTKLCRSNPFSTVRRQAVTAYRAYREKNATIKVRDKERFEGMRPAVDSAREHLSHLLVDLEHAIAIASVLNRTQINHCSGAHA